jgi:RNA:NAD 2'-phosphotransferase (TPT1/KptA family)
MVGTKAFIFVVGPNSKRYRNPCLSDSRRVVINSISGHSHYVGLQLPCTRYQPSPTLVMGTASTEVHVTNETGKFPITSWVSNNC